MNHEEAGSEQERRGIALDEDEISLLTAGWQSVERLIAESALARPRTEDDGAVEVRWLCRDIETAPAFGKVPR